MILFSSTRAQHRTPAGARLEAETFSDDRRRANTTPARVAVGNLIALAVLGHALPGSAAVASPAQATDQVMVQYDDLDLTRTEGAAALYLRLQQAARIVCDPYKRDPLLRNVRRKCYESTLRDAVQRIDRPALAALHRTHMRGSYRT